MELLARPIKLVGGPLHGQTAEATRDVFRRDGHTYVPEGDSRDAPFRLVGTVIHEMTLTKRQKERKTVITWFRNLNVDPPGLDDIPDWRLNAWLLYLDPRASALETYLEKDLDAIPQFKHYGNETDHHHQRQARRS